MARRAPKSVPDVLAAVDLGSNSFHMVVARYTHGQLVILDRLREMVRLGAGLEADGRLNKDVGARALACLERFGQRLRDMRPDSVRVVGTNALRRARRKEAFIERAREALGHPIEIVSGIEEARLIYSGVSHTMPVGPGRRLVCDIGGGSTEIIIGEGLEPLELESLQIGCVRLSEEFFADGRMSQKRMQRARVAARQAIEPYQTAFRRRGWDEAVGSSGTVRAIGDSIRELDPTATDIGADGLERVIHRLGGVEHIRDLKLNALTDDRKLSFAGGVAILSEVFEQLGIESMKVAEGAMREGLLYDLLGRYTEEDARDRTVRSMQQRYHVDTAQAERVEETTVAFLNQVEESWQLKDPAIEQVLRWAARLHEIGL
ncbi:MAG TPA: exopolyphosphatase, partial [Steroidobacteraceae bacterium]|nr:exopolyphosphatase [Steroidobacteraceae bacterium]